MKRFKFLIISLLVLFIFPLVAFADGGAPMLQEYEVRVSNQNGAKGIKHEWNKSKNEWVSEETTIPYDTVLSIYMEKMYKGELYGETFTDSYEDIDVRLSDCTLLEDKYVPDLEGVEFDEKIYIYKEGAYLYKGPSKVYEKASNDMIPVGTELSVKYDDGMFVYVTYKGTSGWLYTANEAKIYDEGTSVAFINKETITTFASFKIYENPDDTSEVLGEIPSNKVIKPLYDLTQGCHYGDGGLTDCSKYYYVNYNNVKGWIKADSNLAIPEKGLMYYNHEEDNSDSFYNDVSIWGEENEVKVSKNKVLISDYAFYNGFIYGTIRFKYNNKYIYTDFESVELYELRTFVLKEDVSEYDDYNGNELKSTQKAGKIEAYLYESENEGWLYVPKTKKWIKVLGNQLFYEDGADVVYGDVVITPEPEPEPVISPNEETEEENSNISTKQVVSYAIVGSLVLIFVVLFIINMVNNPKKVEEPVKEKPKKEKK